MSRALLLKQFRCMERRIATGAEAIEKQRQIIARLEVRAGDSTMLVLARELLAQMEQAQAGHIADGERIKRLLAR
jgi:hypothetical protein